MIELNKIYNEDCLEGMKRIPDKSIDMILCDLPHGMTDCKWDSIIPFEMLWEQYKRIIKPNKAIVLTAMQPFTSALVMSNPKMFKYDWIWKKPRGTGHSNAKRQPLRDKEDVLVFSDDVSPYIPQYSNDNQGIRYLKQVIEFGVVERDTLHPTQKPVPLFEYLIRTYTNEGETVLDNCMGSGTTAIACINTNRNYIGFELDKHYCEIANERITRREQGVVKNDTLS